MNKTTAFVAGFFGLILAIAIGFFGAYVSANNTAVRHEASIQARYTDLSNYLGAYTNTLNESLGVVQFQAEDVGKLFAMANSKRYGEGGAKGLLLAIQEQNPNLDQSTYLKVIQAIQAGRTDFARRQSEFLDAKRSYEQDLNYFMRGKLMAMAGFPKLDMSKMKTVTSEESDEAFKTGISKPLLKRQERE